MPRGLRESAMFRLAFLVGGVLNPAIRSSMLLLCCCCLSAVSWARAGELVLWASLEGKREVRAVGAVGVPFLPSMALLRMLEMSSLTDGRRAGCSGALLTAEAVSSSCCLRMEVANDREVEVFMGWARQCLETKAILLAGSLCARKGMMDCEERIMVSRAFMRSIARELAASRGLRCVCAATMRCNGGCGRSGNARFGGQTKGSPESLCGD